MLIIDFIIVLHNQTLHSLQHRLLLFDKLKCKFKSRTLISFRRHKIDRPTILVHNLLAYHKTQTDAMDVDLLCVPHEAKQLEELVLVGFVDASTGIDDLDY